MVRIARVCEFCGRSFRTRTSKLPTFATATRVTTKLSTTKSSFSTLQRDTQITNQSRNLVDRHLGIQRLGVRFFAASTSSSEVIKNPRKDEDGHEMTIDITSRAANRLKEIMVNESNPSVALRISVESGGCHGFQYLMSLTDMSKISEEEDTVFQGEHSAKVVMDEPSLELLKGSKVDYTMELIGSQFKIVDNPLATSSCGCGTSFDIKV